MAAAALASAALAAASSGCGGSQVSGREIYERNCTSCHTLTGREHGAPGGDLLVPQLDVASLASFARTMPTSRPLTTAQAKAVARYIYDRAQRRRPR